MGTVQPRGRLQPWQPLSPKYRHADMYRRALVASIDPVRFPLLAAHVARRGFLPDVAIDTPAKRRRNAQPTLRRLRTLADRYEALTMYTLDLDLDDLNLYSRALAAEAHLIVRTWLQGAHLAGTWTVERNREGRTHAHVVTSSGAPDVVGLRRSDTSNLEGLAAYLVKPPDPRLVRPRPKDFSRWTLEELTEMRHAGAEAYLAARATLGPGKRLPHLRSDNLQGVLSALRVIDPPQGSPSPLQGRP